MSTLKTNNAQIGQSATASNNFTWYQPASPDGTVRLGQGNSGATTSDILVASASGLFIGGSTIPAERIVQGTAQTTNGSATYGYTGLPSWVKKITVSFSEVTGTSASCVRAFQLGTSSGYVTSGYLGGNVTVTGSGSGNSVTFSSYFATTITSQYNFSGVITFCLLSASTNTWVMSGVTAWSNTSWYSAMSAGNVVLPGTLDRIQLYTPAGTFSGGSVNIIYEG